MLVEKRIGVGWTINLGNPVGLIVGILPIVIIIVLIIYLIIVGV